MNNLKNSPQIPSNKNFGWFFSAVFAVFSVYSFKEQQHYMAYVAAIISLLFISAVLVNPIVLRPLNHLWYELGVFLGKIISPIVLGIIFFVIITPVSLLTRLFGRDEMKIKRRYVQSYWVDRSPPGPPPESFKNQF